MWLGPPFDDSGLRRQLRWGAVTAVVLAGGMGYLLATAGHTVGRGIHVAVKLGHPGPLHAGARVWLAGNVVGEVRDVSWQRRGVLLDVFLQKGLGLPSNTTPFVFTPSVLGEAGLELGPPDHADPTRALVDGDTLTAADPPNLDDFLVKVERSLSEVLELARDNGPAASELAHAVDALMDDLRGIQGEPGRATRIWTQGMTVLDDARAFVATLRAVGIDRSRSAATALLAAIDDLQPELRAFTRRAEGIDIGLPADARRQAAAALNSLGKSAKRFQRLVADIQTLVANVERGEGAVGAFLQDREIFDDLHEAHRIIKSQPLRLVIPQR